MLHAISTEKFGSLGKPMADAVSQCVHCGFCLAACPTYRELGQEMDTPRGRIVLMKDVLEGHLPWESAQPHVDRCLGCLACEPACPSGVPYRDLISPFRAVAQASSRRSLGERFRRFITAKTLPYPNRFRLAARLGIMARTWMPWLPRGLKPMLELLPEQLPAHESWPAVTPARGERRARVALLIGCAQQVLDPDINSATIEVLSRNGVEVVIPAGQGCCGGLAWHTGDLAAARGFARRNLAAFPEDVDAILTNAAGCGSALHEYALILRGTPQEVQAESFCERVQDVSAFLARLGLRDPFAERQLKVAYHDACHLSNAQGVRRQPRDLLRAIPGMQVVEIIDSDLCCGSAGSYNLDQPAIAASLGEQKARAIIATGAEVVVSGNIGCLTQLRHHLQKSGSKIPVRHTFQLLRDAYQQKGLAHPLSKFTQ
ncbi:MAG TPA: heterodisulfide reductase-related iron-sulfur binding cluster [Verrucomicrobiota bacterium]|nr:2-hydroxy-acid oxidase [Verrucomicrobiales bacterium]HRI13622.1 heterodisulfide reductase-related iron-sulfur binding cluster [Verrucomicrobiota bacterium]